MTNYRHRNRTHNRGFEDGKSLFSPTGEGISRAEKAILVGVGLPGDSNDAIQRSLDELQELARTAGAEVVGRLVQKRTRIVGSSYVGKGKLEELAETVAEQKAGLVIFDNDLTPAQGKNVESALRAKVIDRSELILDIFAIHARTDAAKMQVELAQLEYALPRLKRLWDHLSRLGGGIGTRGPGETQLEVDRRSVRERISRLKKHLRRIGTSLEVQRKARRNHVTGSLVGYTNAGKSTLLNALSGAGVYEADELFATLDTTSRVVELDKDYSFVLSDTVGFINKLPHSLVESFQATLAEVKESDFLLHVVDASSEDAELQIDTVHRVLEELGVQRKPVVLVLNKEDLVQDELSLNELLSRHGPGMVVSARTGRGLDELREAIRLQVASRNVVVDLDISAADSAVVARVHREGEVLEKEFVEDRIRLRARLPRPWAEKLRALGLVPSSEE